MHLSTEEPTASRMLGPFGEVGGDVPEYFSSRTHFAKIEDNKLLRKISSKNLTTGVFLMFNIYEEIGKHIVPLMSRSAVNQLVEH